MSDRQIIDNLSIDLKNVQSVENRMFRYSNSWKQADCSLVFYMKNGDILQSNRRDCNEMKKKLEELNNKLK